MFLWMSVGDLVDNLMDNLMDNSMDIFMDNFMDAVLGRASGSQQAPSPGLASTHGNPACSSKGVPKRPAKITYCFKLDVVARGPG